jgi:hypothetical protein
MTIEQITDIAWAVVSELEPSRSVDVFDVTDKHIIFQDEHGLKRVCLARLNGSLKEQIIAELKTLD